MAPREARLSSQFRMSPTHYEPTERLAVGGMAEVWKAEAILETGQRLPVAIKRVLPKLAANPLYRSMFEDEARLGMMLVHPNIVRVYDAREIKGTYIIVMELVEGVSLRDVFEHAQAREIGMPVAATLFAARELARALAYAHEARDMNGKPLGIVHRDVSPHNVLCGKTGQVKLTDFGLANASTNKTEEGEGMVGGKFGYLAPEIIASQPPTPSVDVFAVGIILWECLTGKRLFQGPDDVSTIRNVAACNIPKASSINPAVPAEVDDLLMRVLTKDPAQRIPSAELLAMELNELVAQVDGYVSERDIGLIVSLLVAHGGNKRAKVAKAPADVAALLAEELSAFADAANEEADTGEMPLDPRQFAARIAASGLGRP